MGELLALSIRQPWAWAILHAGKDIENRDWRPANPGLRFRGRFLIHASLHVASTYTDLAVIRDLGGKDTPALAGMPRGGIVGEAEIVDVVRDHDSPWFFGPIGLVLRNVKPLPFRPCKGALGFFRPTCCPEAGDA